MSVMSETQSRSLPAVRAEAITKEPNPWFFTVIGHFKRWSEVRPPQRKR
jgi:hypothetical protein